MQALRFLGQVHRADAWRVLILRSAADYTVPPPGMTAADELEADETGSLPGYQKSLASAYAVASPVVRQLAARGTGSVTSTGGGVRRSFADARSSPLPPPDFGPCRHL